MPPNYLEETVEDEIEKLRNGIERLNVKILHNKRSLNRIQARKARSIKKCHTKIALKLNQIAALSPKSDPATNKKGDQDSSSTTKNESEEEQLLVSTNWNKPTKKQVAWQLERHIQWETRNPPWKNRGDLHKILDLRTGAELEQGMPLGAGNTSLNPKYCRLDPQGYKWGLPASALLNYARKFFVDPEEWILMDKPRSVLISMESWFFSLSDEQRDELPDCANEWTGMPEATNLMWNQAAQVGELK
ncbi:uncharacterized protein N7483_007043 [Penicillium malachiteum]|uniref:uncharacterized protein n=1 Tax=Penicillium malachiteum TaxID=1324776 RepID=UPI002547336D|nr:uncharacterized protein N7483_007043 [Penicillium malachiteum]KAJ5725686.1 hypothetical protein N7483_007043 [Penicillium malachiteum]